MKSRLSRPALYVLLSILGLVFVFAFILVIYVHLQDPWIEAVPGVRLEPSRPILRENDLKPDSVVEALRKMTAAMWKPSQDLELKINAERLKLGLVPWTDKEFPATQEALTKNEKAIELARRVVEVPDPQVVTLVSLTEDNEHLSPAINMAKLLKASAQKKVSTGDYAGAFDDMQTAAKLGDVMTRGGPLINRLVDIAIAAIACSTMRWIALQHDVPPDVTRKAIGKLRELDKNMEPWDEVYRYEALINESSIRMIYSPPRASSGRSSPFELGGPGFGMLVSQLGPLMGSTPAATRQSLLNFYTHLISKAGKTYDAIKEKNFEDRLVELRAGGVSGLLTTRDPVGRILATLLFPAYAGCDAKHYNHIALLRATEVVLAIRQFEQAEKHPPGTLDELVPRWLPEVPTDPFDGKPLRYRVNADGTWVVYSVGPNQKDDGGVQPKERPPNNYKESGDAVFPSTEVKDEKVRLK